jgi:hypothetical protein
MLGRIEAVVAAREHRDCSGGETCRMCRRIDAARQSGDGGETGFAQFARDPLREFQSRAGSVARADHGDHGQREHAGVAADGDQGRRIVNHLQPQGVVGLTQRHEGDAEFFRGGDLALGVGLRADFHRRVGAAAAGKRGQRRERRAGAAEMVDQGAKGAWARYYGANAGSRNSGQFLAHGGIRD